jgi:excisionase family DNA binding protein
VERYLTVRNVAAALNLHKNSVYRLVETGELPAVQILKLWFVRPRDLQKLKTIRARAGWR